MSLSRLIVQFHELISATGFNSTSCRPIGVVMSAIWPRARARLGKVHKQPLDKPTHIRICTMMNAAALHTPVPYCAIAVATIAHARQECTGEVEAPRPCTQISARALWLPWPDGRPSLALYMQCACAS